MRAFFTLLSLQIVCVIIFVIFMGDWSSVFPSPFRCDSTAKLKAQLNGLKSLTSDSTTFKKIYRYAFDFCRVSLNSFLVKLQSLCLDCNARKQW